MDNLARLLCGRAGPTADGPASEVVTLLGDDWDVTVGNMKIMMEGADKVERVLALTMAHSVFNRRFAKRTKALCLFVQKVVLSIDDGSKLPAAVAKLCHELA